jgi:uncharacterized protein
MAGVTNAPMATGIGYLATALRKEGHVVAYPQLPDTELPSLAKWLAVLKVELDLLNEAGDGELIVFGHSLGCLTWLHIATEQHS